MNPDPQATSGLGLPPPSNMQGDSAMGPHPTDHVQGNGTITANDAAAANSDDLDQEWVDRAKAIVDRTKDDPFLESRELNKVKADYLKRRYNKDIKVSEDNT
jgi:hypothetical protein